MSEDHWHFDGCPENGPAIAIDREQRAHVVWLTPLDGKEETQLVLYHAVSRDGRSFGARTRIPTLGPAAHAQVAFAPNGSLLVAWDELVGGMRRVALARGRVDAAGKATFTSLESPEDGDSAHPVVAATATGAVVAWVRRTERGNTIGVARVR